MAKRSRKQDKAVQGGEPGRSGTTERDHGAQKSRQPQADAEAAGAQGAKDERSGLVSRQVRSDGDGPIPGSSNEHDELEG
jgi:hypothetical protein